MGASDSGWCPGARPVRGWAEDCSTGRAWRWILHHLGGINLGTENSDPVTCSSFPVLTCRQLCQFYCWMVPANILECQVHVGLLWDLWTIPFLIHIYCASHALLWWKCAGSVLLWSHTAVRPAECGLLLGGPFPGHGSMISIIWNVNWRT